MSHQGTCSQMSTHEPPQPESFRTWTSSDTKKKGAAPKKRARTPSDGRTRPSWTSKDADRTLKDAFSDARPCPPKRKKPRAKKKAFSRFLTHCRAAAPLGRPAAVWPACGVASSPSHTGRPPRCRPPANGHESPTRCTFQVGCLQGPPGIGIL